MNCRRFLIALLMVVCPYKVMALEEQTDTLSASVEVAPVFRVSLSQPALVFSSIESGHSEVLGAGPPFHDIICRSNNGRVWSRRGRVIMLRHAQQPYNLTPAALAWNLVDVMGRPLASPSHGFTPFSDSAQVLYVSEGDAVAGREMVLRFQYRLTIPPGAPAGNYIGQVVFTMSEDL